MCLEASAGGVDAQQHQLFGDQHAKRMFRRDYGRGRCLAWRHDRFADPLQWQLHGECRTRASPAYNADVSAHQVGEIAADGKAKTRAAKPPGRGGVRLREFAKEMLHRVLRHADTRVGDREDHAAWARFGSKLYGSGRGEFHGVGEQIVDDLA